MTSNNNTNITYQEENICVPQCSICKKDYELDDIIVSTPCDHVFHKACIVEVLKETLGCPICGKGCRQNKLKSYNIFSEQPKTSSVTPAPSQTLGNTSRGAIPKALAPRRNSLSQNLFDWRMSQPPVVNTNSDGRHLDDFLSGSRDNVNINDNSLQDLIHDAVRNQLSNMKINENSYNRNSLDGRNANNNNNRFRRNTLNRPSIAQGNNQAFNLATDKVSTIISSWQIKFSGQEEGGLSVDNFIYRVQALTMQSLRGDFNILCRHIHLLFTGKAIDWFWRFHRTAGTVDWDLLCNELRNQFRDRRTDFDLKELIRSRKQRMGEKFDTFYDSILQISSFIHKSFRFIL